MILGPVAFKTMVLVGDTWEVSSPSWPAKWSDLGLIEAVCNKCKPENIPGHNCTCGIYATLDHNYARSYADQPGSVLFVIEGTGNVEMYTEGFRSQQGFVVAVVSDKTFDMENRLVADRFECDIVSLPLAVQVVKKQWKKLGMEWPYD